MGRGTVSHYQRNEDASVFVGFRAQMDIPVVNPGNPLVRQRHAEYHQRITTFEQLQARAELEARAAIDRYQRARRLIDRSQGEFGESMPAELQRLEAQFKAGEVDVLRVFTARTSFFQLRRARLDSLNEVAQAAAAVTAATGLPPATLILPGR